MASQWYYRNESETCGPVLFRDLAHLMADGILMPSSEVRRAGSDDWQRIGTVIGMTNAIERLRSQIESELPVPTAGSGEPDSGREAVSDERPALNAAPAPAEKSEGARRATAIRIGIISLVVGVAVCAGWLLWSRATRFPKPSYVQSESAEWSSLLFGELSGLEWAIIGIDALVIVGSVVWWIRSRQDRRSPR